MRILIAVVVGFIALISCSEKSKLNELPLNLSAGKLYRFEQFDSKFMSPRIVDVWVPNGYSSDIKYSVLYMHDGQMLFDSTNTWNKSEWGVDETISQLIDQKKIKPTIVVGIWHNSTTRHSDYFPRKPFDLLPQSTQDSLLKDAVRPNGTHIFNNGIQSDNYMRFIVEELKPFVDSNFSTNSSQQTTFIAGSSMGGLISLYAICEYPGVFGAAACLSTHWTGVYKAENNPIPGVILDYLKSNTPNPHTHHLYFDYGTETLDALYEPFQLRADTILLNRGYDSNSLKTLKFNGKDHSEQSWKERLAIPLEFLLK